VQSCATGSQVPASGVGTTVDASKVGDGGMTSGESLLQAPRSGTAMVRRKARANFENVLMAQ
jgi:hypothetical protein